MSKRFLIGQLERFGDCLYATTLAKQIKHDYPDAHITWAVLSKYKSILDLNPYIDEVWEINPAANDYYGVVWSEFETEALKRKANGEFDEIIFSQIHPKNWDKYNGTIRGTILSTYQRPITVSVEPVVRLSKDEIENVKKFAAKNNLQSFENVILFECAPGSQQSKVDIKFALKVAETITQYNSNICFVLSSAEKLNPNNQNIIDGSELTFRENAELTKYCTVLVGCSSGITWLSTSDWAKKLPTIQLLNDKLSIFAGMHYDFKANNLDNGHIIEMVEFDEQTAVNCILSVINKGIEKTKEEFHQTYQPGYFDLKNNTKRLIHEKKTSKAIIESIENYLKKNEEAGNKISAKYLYFYTYIYGFIYRNLKKLDKGIFRQLRKKTLQ